MAKPEDLVIEVVQWGVLIDSRQAAGKPTPTVEVYSESVGRTAGQAKADFDEVVSTVGAEPAALCKLMDDALSSSAMALRNELDDVYVSESEASRPETRQ